MRDRLPRKTVELRGRRVAAVTLPTRYAPSVARMWTDRVREVERVGTPMTTIQAVVFGVMLALTPSMLVLAFLLWREGIGLADDGSNGEAYFHRKY